MEGLTRQHGESSADWQRRYHREKMRRRRAAIKAANPDAPRKFRGKNKAPSNGGTLSEEEWEELQPLPGETSEEHKRRYQRVIQRRWRAKNKEKEAARRRELYSQNKEYEAEKRKRKKKANPEKYREYSRRHFEKNREAKIAALREWGRLNPDRLRQWKKKWREDHPGIANAAVARCRARAVQATPPWMWSLHGTEVEAVYNEAAKLTRQTGIPHQVDHIEPLAGKDRCGLHVPWNLRVITAEENRKKRNNAPEQIDSTDASPERAQHAG